MSVPIAASSRPMCVTSSWRGIPATVLPATAPPPAPPPTPPGNTALTQSTLAPQPPGGRPRLGVHEQEVEGLGQRRPQRPLDVGPDRNEGRLIRHRGAPEPVRC